MTSVWQTLALFSAKIMRIFMIHLISQISERAPISCGNIECAEPWAPCHFGASTIEGWLDRFLNGRIALPAFVLQFNVLQGHGIRAGVKIWQRLKLGHPAAVHLVSNY